MKKEFPAGAGQRAAEENCKCGFKASLLSQKMMRKSGLNRQRWLYNAILSYPHSAVNIRHRTFTSAQRTFTFAGRPKTTPSGLSVCRTPPGVDKGPQPLIFHPALRTQGELPRRGKRRPLEVCVRTDENPEVFVRCRFCRPGANARGKTCENSKKWRSSTFSTLGQPLRACVPWSTDGIIVLLLN